MKLHHIITATALVLSFGFAKAQEYKIQKSTGRLEIKEVNNVTIEGYAGNEIVFSTRGDSREDDDRAKGLRAISRNGLEDNSGIGLSIVDKGTTIEVNQLKKMDGPDVKILVPKGVSVSYTHTSPHGSDIHLKNVEGEIDISTVHNGVYLDNVTGVVNIKTVHGEVEAVFGPALKNKVDISSVHGHIDVTLPVATKANIELGTTWGEIFVDPDFKMEFDKKGDLVRYNDNVSGKINGGGVEISLTSTHSNVYLRKK